MKKPCIYIDTSVEPQIHAVEMVRRIREEHYAQLKELAPQETIAFFRRKASVLHAELGRRAERVR